MNDIEKRIDDIISKLERISEEIEKLINDKKEIEIMLRRNLK